MLSSLRLAPLRLLHCSCSQQSGCRVGESLGLRHLPHVVDKMSSSHAELCIRDGGAVQCLCTDGSPVPVGPGSWGGEPVGNVKPLRSGREYAGSTLRF